MNTITITNNARLQLLNILQDKNIVRIGLRSGGCTGFKYHIEIDNNSLVGDDFSIDLSNGKSLVIDPLSLTKLAGLEIDYVTSTLSSEFVFNNPNTTASCGCNKSVAFD